MNRTVLIRAVTLLAALVLSSAGSWLFLKYTGQGGLTVLDLVRTGLVMFTGFWLVWGAATAVLGLLVPHRAPKFDPTAKPSGMTVILVPVFNEDPLSTFARVAAMSRSLIALGIEERFHIAILSDSNSLDAATEEAVWFETLLREPGTTGRIFYRRRTENVGKKAGNIEDFILRSGGAYDYALILDADSLMEGETIGELARRMDADPKMGLLQTVPRIINARSIFGRSMQFSASYLSPTFARGAALMQGNEGPYWGHNAIVRVSAFAANCGLPVLSGRPPYGGHILSHDYVEAALLSRAGWTVNVDPTLEGSFEEGPENLIEYAKRDRRWCQGNLQHRRLVFSPDLRWWNRFTFVQGIMAYIASPLWLLLLAASIAAAIFPDRIPYFRGPREAMIGLMTLGIAVAMVLVLPKLLILLRGMIDGQNRSFGGTIRTLLSIIGEIAFSTVLAPILLLLQTRAVFQVLFGLDGGWPATHRTQNRIKLADAFAATWWIMLIGALTLGAILIWAPPTAVWVAPAMVPAILAPFLITLGSLTVPGNHTPLLFLTPAELAPSPVIAEHHRIVADWSGQSEPDHTAAVLKAQHVPA